MTLPGDHNNRYTNTFKTQGSYVTSSLQAPHRKHCDLMITKKQHWGCSSTSSKHIATREPCPKWKTKELIPTVSLGKTERACAVRKAPQPCRGPAGLAASGCFRSSHPRVLQGLLVVAEYGTPLKARLSTPWKHLQEYCFWGTWNCAAFLKLLEQKQTNSQQ